MDAYSKIKEHWSMLSSSSGMGWCVKVILTGLESFKSLVSQNEPPQNKVVDMTGDSTLHT